MSKESITPTIITSAPELAAVEVSKAQKIKEVFAPMAQLLESFEAEYEEIIDLSKKEITTELAARAKRARIDISKIRIQTAKAKDKEKAEYLRASKAIQGVHNVLVWAVKDKEEKLKEIEDHERIQAEKRLKELQEKREKILAPYVDNASEMNLMVYTDEEFDVLVGIKKKAKEDHDEAVRLAAEAKKKKEEEEAKEKARLAKENEKLRKEAEANKKKAEAAEALAKKANEKAAAEAKKRMAEQKAKDAALQRIAEAKAKEEKTTTAKEPTVASGAPTSNTGHYTDTEVLEEMIVDIRGLVKKYESRLKSPKGISAAANTFTLLNKVVGYLLKKIDGLN